jgi:mxaL protein
MPVFKKLLKNLSLHRDLALLSSSFICLMLAFINPSIHLKHNIYSYFIVLDITQSMNAADMQINGKPVSRLAFSKKMVSETLSTLPCGTKVGLGLFSGVNVVALYTPIELCENFSSLQDTLEHAQWLNAWTADSRVREGLLASAQVMNNFPEPAQLVFLTDGEEAPKLHAFNTRDLSTFQGADGWLIAGVGSLTGGPIPKYDEKRQHIGFWSHESMQLAPGAAPIAAAGILQRKSDLAESPQDRYVSKLAETYLQNTAKEISANYVRVENSHGLFSAMERQKPARRESAPFALGWFFAILSSLIILCAYLPWEALIKHLKKIEYRPKKLAESHQVAFSNVSTESV